MGLARYRYEEAAYVRRKAAAEARKGSLTGRDNSVVGAGAASAAPTGASGPALGGVAAGAKAELVAEQKLVPAAPIVSEQKLAQLEAAELAAAHSATDVLLRPLDGMREWNVSISCGEGKCPVCKKVRLDLGLREVR